MGRTSLSDINPPEIRITAPTSSPVYTNTTGTLNLTGTADDNLGLAQGTVVGVTWANSQGGGGNATGITNWSVSDIPLLPGTNILSVTAADSAGNSSNATLTVIYQTPKQSQTITFPALADKTFGDPPFPLVAAASSGLPVSFNVVSGPASLSNNVLTLTGAGVVTVQADQPGNGTFNPATPVPGSFNVARANQSIAFAPVPAKSASDTPFALSATSSSGLPVYFNILSGPGVLDTNNEVTLFGAGALTVIAWQPGNSNYNAALPVQQSFTVGKVPQSITFGALSQQQVGDAPFPLTATASSGLPVGFSLISGPATVSGNIVALEGWGTVSVSASQPGNNTYAAAPDVVQAFFVVPLNNTIANPQRMPDGAFEFEFYGAVGSNYTLQASTSLTDWSSLFNFACTNSPTVVLDMSATNQNRRFYRVAGQ